MLNELYLHVVVFVKMNIVKIVLYATECQIDR